MDLVSPTDEASLVRLRESRINEPEAAEVLQSGGRDVAAQMVWQQINRDAPTFCSRVEAILRQPTSKFVLAGIAPADIHVRIQTVKTPQEHRAAMTMLEMAPVDAQRMAIDASDVLSAVRAEQMRVRAKESGRTLKQQREFFGQHPDLHREFDAYCQDILKRAHDIKRTIAPAPVVSAQSSSGGGQKRAKGSAKNKKIENMSFEELWDAADDDD